MANRSRDFSIKSTCSLLVKKESDIEQLNIWGYLWSSKLHERRKIFLWKVASNDLAVKANLCRFLLRLDARYSLCLIENEIVKQLWVLAQIIVIMEMRYLYTPILAIRYHLIS